MPGYPLCYKAPVSEVEAHTPNSELFTKNSMIFPPSSRSPSVPVLVE